MGKEEVSFRAILDRQEMAREKFYLLFHIKNLINLSRFNKWILVLQIISYIDHIILPRNASYATLSLYSGNIKEISCP